jgi:hypothetical protein
MERARSACQSLAAFGVWAGWSLTVVGLVEGLVRAAGAVTALEITPVRRVAVLAQSVGVMICWLVAGWGTCFLSRLTAASKIAYLERFSRAADELALQMVRAISLLESHNAGLGKRTEIASSADIPHTGRAVALAEIERATRSAQWAEAEGLIAEFEARFPGDSQPAELRQDLAAARRRVIQHGLAQLDAARKANDAEGLLELYPAVASTLDEEARGSLASEVAGWFLTLIHRRLRAGKIQADLVQLAGRFAETFATTVEGASVRASLSTLRRSVGLCPRCAQPYNGDAEACPACLGETATPPGAGATKAEPTRIL